MLALTSAHRRTLAATAHAIRPIVMIGNEGLSESVMRELDIGLKSHQLIKVKVFAGEREARNGLMNEICQRLAAAPVQHIGKILVIYRPEPESTTVELLVSPKKKISGKNNRGSRSTPPRRVESGSGNPKHI